MNAIQANVKTIDPTLRAFVLAIDDLPWSSPKARAEGMKKIAIAQLDSLGKFDSIWFARKLAKQTIQRLLPPILRQIGLHEAADRCEREGTEQAARDAADAADAADAEAAAKAAVEAAFAAASAAYAHDACLAAVEACETACCAADAAVEAARSVREAETYAAYANASAARAAANAAEAAAKATETACCAAHAAHYAAEARDGVLTLMCDICIDILRDMRAPGIALMDQVCLPAC